MIFDFLKLVALINDYNCSVFQFKSTSTLFLFKILRKQHKTLCTKL